MFKFTEQEQESIIEYIKKMEQEEGEVLTLEQLFENDFLYMVIDPADPRIQSMPISIYDLDLEFTGRVRRA